MGSLDSGIVAADLPRRRLGQVFRYLQELNLVRNPVIQEVRQQLSGFWLRALPEHPSIRIGSYTPGTGDDEQNAGTDFVLQVRRPQVTPPPDPPKPIREWLKPGWDKPATAVETYPSRNMPGRQGQTRLVRFADDPRRSIALKGWREKRDEWARNEVPAREALRAFERIYAIYGEVQREEERVELVLGDGILCWDREEGRIHHPVLLQRLHLEFDPEVPEFTFRETDQAVELYSALFRSLPEVNGRQLAKVQNELEVGDYHPLDQEATAGFLRRLIQGLFVDGEYVETGEPQGSQPHPRLGRAPMIFLRRRTLGFQTALEAILRDLQETDELPQALLRLVGFELPLEIPLESYGDTLLGNEDEAVLLSKPANREQVEIARRLERHGCVLVQGPPGTGKSHTIANLLGHLLAQGKSVLVTAHTTKALRVLHEQVVPTLRPLCVSVLDRDSRDQLERSVNGIVKRASSDADKLEAEGEVYARERAHLLERLKQGRQRLLEARQDEYRELTVGGKAYSPAAAARKVAEGVGKDDWIPGPLLPGTVLPLSEGEVLDLYRTNATVSYEDERELEAALPPSMELPSPAEFRHMLKERARLVETAKLLREELWEPEGSGRRQPERLETLCQNLSQALAPLREEVPWRLAAIRAGRTGGALLDV